MDPSKDHDKLHKLKSKSLILVLNIISPIHFVSTLKAPFKFLPNSSHVVASSFSFCSYITPINNLQSVPIA